MTDEQAPTGATINSSDDDVSQVAAALADAVLSGGLSGACGREADDALRRLWHRLHAAEAPESRIRPILDRYYDYTSVWHRGDPGMVGGVEGRRFMTNGHFMVLITEEDFASALDRNWRNVTSDDTWQSILDIGDGQRVETTTVPAMAALRGGSVEIGSVTIMAKYVGLLLDLGATEVLVVHDKPMAFVIAPGIAIVSATPNGDPS